MFSNLAQGSILYGLETKDEIKVFTAPITNVSLPRPMLNNTTFGQLPQMTIDITATVNGEKREFKQLPGNTTIANFGSDAFFQFFNGGNVSVSLVDVCCYVSVDLYSELGVA